MSHRLPSVRGRLRGLAVLLTCAGLGLPLLAAAGGAASSADDVLALARAQVGDPYVWGATGPDTFDCSGLTSFAWHEAGGVDVPRTSQAQQRWAVPIPREQLLPGDLVFFGVPVTHVALYAGDGAIVDASSSKRGVVERRLWSATDARYGRVPRPDMPVVLPWTPPPPPVVVSPSPSATAPAGTAVALPLGTVVPPAPSVSPSVSPSARAVTPPASARPTPSGASTKAGTVARPVGTAAPAASAKPVPSARPVASAKAVASAKPVASAPVASAKPAATKLPAARPTASPVSRVAGLPAHQTRPSTPLALAAVANARSVAGLRTFTDVALVREAWRHAGGGLLPATRDALVGAGTRVSPGDVRIGDLVVYGAPGAARSVSLYVGSGWTVGVGTDGRVAVRRVVAAADLRFVHLPG